MKNTYSIGGIFPGHGLVRENAPVLSRKGNSRSSSVDETTGYRFYDPGKIEKARVIMRLRQMEFSIEDVTAVLGECSDEADILNYLEQQKNTLQQRIQEDRDIVHSLNEIIAKEKAARQLLESSSFAWKKKFLSRC